jgi:hypothetical protein
MQFRQGGQLTQFVLTRIGANWKEIRDTPLQNSLRCESGSETAYSHEICTVMRLRTRAFRNCIVKGMPTTYLQPER